MSEREPRMERFTGKATPELLPGQLPVMVHRWFDKTGEGWAYNPSLDYVKILRDPNVNRFFWLDITKAETTDPGGGYKIPLKTGQWFVCTVKPDAKTKFWAAKGRSPFYLAATVVSGPEPVDTRLEEIYDQLDDLPWVESQGPNDSLVITEEE